MLNLYQNYLFILYFTEVYIDEIIQLICVFLHLEENTHSLKSKEKMSN